MFQSFSTSSLRFLALSTRFQMMENIKKVSESQRQKNDKGVSSAMIEKKVREIYFIHQEERRKPLNFI
jgi:hypothetical protein